MQLFVLGMHRSGTSAVTRILNMAGAHFGPEGISNGADAGNPKGFWERVDVRRVCDGLLQEAGFDWWRVDGFDVDAIPEDVRDRHLTTLRSIIFELDAHRPWVVKEPRLSLLFPLVRPLLEVPVCVHVVREPLEVARSLRTRNGFPVHAGLALWEVYTAHAFRSSEGVPRVLVRYDELMTDPVSTVEALLASLAAEGVQGLRTPTAREVTAFLSPALHRERATPAERAASMNPVQLELAAAVDDGRILDQPHALGVSQGATDALRALVDQQEQRRELQEVTARSASLAEEVDRLQEDRAGLSDEVQRARHSHDALQTRHRSEVASLEGERDDLVARLGEAERLRDLAAETLRNAERDIRSVARSRTWRLASQLNDTRRVLTPGSARQRRSPLQRVTTELRRTRDHLQRSSSSSKDDDDVPRARALRPATEQPSSHRPGGGRPKVAVIAWEVGHNPLGRAYVMADMLRDRYDVEIWGAQFERYGREVWEPLRHSSIPIRTFPGVELPGHVDAMATAAQAIDADVVWVSKPRFPSLALGIMAAQRTGAPLVLDVDDHELTFFDVDSGLAAEDLRRTGATADTDLRLPFGRTWTQLCDGLIPHVDHVTVSNAALQRRYGGVIVPHARDEALFDPARYDRDEVRRELGFAGDHRLLLFGGTPRVHKGVLEVARALDELGDPRNRLLCFGTREFETIRRHLGELERWVTPLPQQPFEALPRLLAAADLACVLQDPAHPISRFQIPAKVTDALAMEVPCLVSPVPPLAALIDDGVLEVHDGSVPLSQRIQAILAEPGEAAERAALGRKVFLESYSYAATGAGAAALIDEALADGGDLAPELLEAVRLPREVLVPAEQTTTQVVPPRRPLRDDPARRIPSGPDYDVVVLWKQNDSDIYGRRQDMVVRYLATSGRVGSIVHFDRPVAPEDLYGWYRRSRGSMDQTGLVLRQTVARILHRRDTGVVRRRTYVHAGRRSGGIGVGGVRLPPAEAFAAHVRSMADRYGDATRPTVLLAYPTNDALPDVIDAIDPDIVVTDVVDDHRTFCEPGSERYEAFERNYREVLARSDVVVANCEPVAEAMGALFPEVHCIPNGLEIPRDDGPTGPRPPDIADLEGPVIGYVGNLSQRLDIALLEAVVRARPLWEFVFVGSTHHDRSVLRLEREPNVRFVGVKPYDQTRRYISHFDVALIPHLVNGMTASMNPLKAYVYGSCGVPVVSTPVANLADLGDLVTVAEGPQAFVDAIEDALRHGRRLPDREVLRPHSWEERVAHLLALVDGVARRTRR
jgi:glycosyltransferase involved in cell wall biosynthesis